ncbi:hypothetical protein LF1_45810 [Rubripirellula obstinata]|uniref:Uncharacterized protein n=1 Tax=Rubripirellula obstinata TaxID=406547 RepID=A0A5B1CQU9_9BACT|nr:hypothetical protein [Rubripirellula obstinata]KAA1262020.1 hypothetical protein LF1_45810 [Rubripirellula obstinata]
MSFEPFAAQCLTCGSRLRVSSEALLGTIAACPKCGSMVKIEKPPQVKLGNVPVDSEAITEDGISTEFPGVSDASTESATGEFKTGFADAPPIPNLDDSDDTTIAGPPPTWQDNENWQSDKTKRTRHIAMIATIAISTLSVTVLTFGWFMRMQSKPVAVAEATEMETDPLTQIDPLTQAPGEATTLDSEQDVTPTDLEPPEQTDPIEPVPDPFAESSVETTEVADPIDVPQTVIPSSLIPKSPIETSSGDQEPETDQDAPTMKELPAGLQQFMPMTLNEGPAQETSLAAPPTINEIEIDAAAEEDSNTLGIEPPKPIDLKRDLGFKVYFNSKGYPLPSLLLLISEMTGVPIQIDWTSFDIAGIDVAKPIKVVGNAQTCRQWLDTIAEQVDAEIREKEFVIVMTLTDKAFAKAETGMLDLADFGDRAKSAEQVVNEFIGPENPVPENVAPEAVGVEEALGKLNEELEGAESIAGEGVMQARERAQLKVLATEMLRRMRSIQPRLPDDRAGRWMQISDDRLIDWQPIGDVDPAELKPGTQPDTPITTAAMLRKISSINDAVCLVNWYDANRRGMRPTRLVMPRADKISAAKMLSSVLDPLSMEVRRVDAKHWWVGSNATYDRLPVLVHSDRLGKGREAYVRQLDEIMSADPDAVYQSAYDPVSDRMLLLLPRYVARQLEKLSQEIARR